MAAAEAALELMAAMARARSEEQLLAELAQLLLAHTAAEVCDILIGEPEYLGCGVGPKALALLLVKLRGDGVGFAGLGVSMSNRAAIRAYEKAGFRVFRDFQDPESGPCEYPVAPLRPRGV